LRCAGGTLYTGIAKDVNLRCQHNAGTASRYTRSRLPVELVYREAHASRSLALKREAAIKALPRQQKEALIRLAGWARSPQGKAGRVRVPGETDLRTSAFPSYDRKLWMKG
jgi:predicted GIY-YIG superfamily endonuclease